MDVEVGRLAIRCRGSAEGSRVLAARRRMEQVARGPLPAALARVLGGVDVEVDRLEVPMELDPLAYDSETLATLWADHIRVALAARLTGAPLPSAPGELAPQPRPEVGEDPSLPARSDPHRGATDPSRRRLVRLIAAASPAALVALARAAVAEQPQSLSRLWAALPASERAQVLRRLESAISALADEPSSRARGGGRNAARGGVARPGEPRRPGPAMRLAWEEAWRILAVAATGRAVRGEPEQPPAALREALTAAVASGAAPAAAPTRGFASEVGGLVLLYPWLGSYLTRAAATLSDLHATDARRAALTLVAHQCVEGTHGSPTHQCVEAMRLQHDPLVRVLAGVVPDADTLHLDLNFSLLGAVATIGAEADALLRTFAGFLAGFERSTTEFLRDQLVLRPAVVEPIEAAVQVTLPPAPLDVLVARLPYPLGSFTLGWTPQFHVRLEVE